MSSLLKITKKIGCKFYVVVSNSSTANLNQFSRPASTFIFRLQSINEHRHSEAFNNKYNVRSFSFQAFNTQKKFFSSYPSHKVVPMPALSPTMESGSIVKWCVKEGDKFEAGTAICEVETDKATVTNEATEDGYIAKILVGSGEVKVGQPLMITVEDPASIAAFANFTATVQAAAPTPPSSPPPVVASSSTVAAIPTSTPISSVPSQTITGDRVIASPYAKKLAREADIPINLIRGTGPHGRIIAEDVLVAQKTGVKAAAAVPAAAIPVSPPAVGKVLLPPTGVPGVYQDFELSDLGLAIAMRQTQSKQFIPHYYLSVEINLQNLLKLRASLNSADEKGVKLSVLDFFIKASALAMKTVPDVNGSWMDTFIRRYSQVDINVVLEGPNGLITPVIRDAGSIGLKTIANELSHVETAAAAEEIDPSKMQLGTFSIHDLGKYGVKSAAPIVISPQCCALSIGSIIDTVIPKKPLTEDDDDWTTAPLVTVTLSCDHRVVDGAVGAQWLAALKTLMENPMNMIL